MMSFLFLCTTGTASTPPEEEPLSASLKISALQPECVQMFLHAPKDKQGKATITLSIDQASISESEIAGVKNALVLHISASQVTMEQALKRPQLRDTVEIRIHPNVVAQLKRLGITDLPTHFQNRTVRATGKPTSTMYLCFPAVEVYSLIVERLEDIEVLPDKPGVKAVPDAPVIKKIRL